MLAALLLAFTFARRTADREYGVGALFSAAAAVHASGALLARLSIHATSTATAERLSWLGLVAAMPLGMHFAVVYAPRSERRRIWLAVVYRDRGDPGGGDVGGDARAERRRRRARP